VATLVLDVPGWPGHRAGQHVDIRLSASDGYQAQRSYSIASTSDATGLDLTVEEVGQGEVSNFLLHEMEIGTVFELRGPIGGYFTWGPGEAGGLMLVAGGSGIVPLMAMLRQRERAGDRTPVSLVYSSRRLEDVIYREELDAMAARDAHFRLTYTLTREQPLGWVGQSRRIDQAMLAQAGTSVPATAVAFVCGPTPMVEHVAQLLVLLGHSPDQIRTERFGPTGDAR
jgi:ferredoxin-NADP reductase